MSTRHLEALFNPRSITVVGASDTQPGVGALVLDNLLRAGYGGQLSVLNRAGYRSVRGLPCHASVAKLPEPPDLAVICTPPEGIPRLVRELGRAGARAAVVIMGGMAGTLSRSGRPLTQSLLEAARSTGIRVLGANSLGVLVPQAKLCASYAHMNIQHGQLAYVGESAVLGASMIDWANGRGIGFSHFLTLGDGVDVDMADVIDYLASDTGTRAILLHVEHIRDAQRFISSVRAASRGKLVLAIKSGRVPESQLPVETPAPGVPGGDAVYDAVFHRAGVLRVGSIDELFDAAETLTRMQPLQGERLAIISNGYGPAAIATDALLRSGGSLARFTPETLASLRRHLTIYSRHDNPVDISILATPATYAAVLEAVRRDPGVDAALLLHAPTRVAPGSEYAQAVIGGASGSRFNVLTSWMGQASVEPARRAFDEAGIPTYATPDQAVQAFMHMVRHRRNQTHLRETPAALMTAQARDRRAAQQLVARVCRRPRRYLTLPEATQLVGAYGIPVAETFFARSAEEAVKLLDVAGPAIALRILHAAHCHPFAYGDRLHNPWRGISFDLATPGQVRRAAQRMQDWARTHYPESRLLGYAAQRMRRGMGSIQISVGLTRDPVFGPLLLFGLGGRQVNVLSDRRIGLPPLNHTLALDLIRGSHIHRVLSEGAEHPQLQLDRLSQVLVALSQLAVELPALRGLEINPLILNRDGALALNVYADVGDPEQMAPLAIRPYPQELAGWAQLADGRRVLIRPIRGEDEPAHLEFHRRLSPQAIRFRYFYNRKNFSHAELAQMTQIDYGREMAFIACLPGGGDCGETLGEVRAWRDPDNIRAEFSLIVRDDLRGAGLGRLLLERMVRYCREQGTLEIVGSVLPDNQPMLRLAQRLGFTAGYDAGNDLMELRLPLHKPRHEWQRRRLQQPII